MDECDDVLQELMGGDGFEALASGRMPIAGLADDRSIAERDEDGEPSCEADWEELTDRRLEAILSLHCAPRPRQKTLRRGIRLSLRTAKLSAA